MKQSTANTRSASPLLQTIIQVYSAGRIWDNLGLSSLALSAGRCCKQESDSSPNKGPAFAAIHGRGLTSVLLATVSTAYTTGSIRAAVATVDCEAATAARVSLGEDVGFVQ